MNSYIKISFLLGMLLLAKNSFGQNWKNDPTYSPNNYKHPNKAAIAREEDAKALENIKYIHPLIPRNANYKAQNLVVMREPRQLQIVSLPANNKSANRNYKQQFAPTARKKK